MLKIAEVKNVRSPSFERIEKPIRGLTNTPFAVRGLAGRLRGDPDTLCVELEDFFNEDFEQADIQGRSRRGLGVELGTKSEPVHHFGFDRLDNAIGAFCRNAESWGDFVNRHVVPTADANFTVAVDPANDRIADDVQRVAVGQVLGIEMRHGGGDIFLDIKK